MADYIDYDGGDSEGVPMKLMLFVGGVGLIGVCAFVIAMSINRKHVDPNIDPSRQDAFEQNDASLQETPDLWVQKKPQMDDLPTATPIKDPFKRSTPVKPSIGNDVIRTKTPTSQPG